jgi:predicted RNase H-like HicB family nuclease
MNLKNQIVESVRGGMMPQEMTFTVVFREVPEESVFVAECLEIPGCVSEGETQAEAEANIKDAVRGCLGVMFEDCVREAARHRARSASYVGIASQQFITVKASPDWDLQTA